MVEEISCIAAQHNLIVSALPIELFRILNPQRDELRSFYKGYCMTRPVPTPHQEPLPIPVIIEGVLEAFWEAGSVGGIQWSVYDISRIKEGRRIPEGRFAIENGDLLTVFNDTSLTSFRKNAAALTYALDRAVGNIIARVNDPNGDGNQSDSIADNTIIVFANDNGGEQPYAASNNEVVHDNGRFL